VNNLSAKTMMNEEINKWLDYSILDNTVSNILIFSFILLFGILLKRFFTKAVNKIMFRFIRRKGDENSGELFSSLLSKPMELLLLLVIYFWAFSFLRFPSWWNLADEQKFGIKMVITRLYETGIAIAVTWLFLRLVDYFVQRYLASQEEPDTPLNKQLIPFVKELVKFIFVFLALFIALGVVYKLDIGAIVAGLGIGGLAVALAGKETIENLFGSFTIFLDKPFVVGDVIQIDNAVGTVESIGFRSTRLRTFDQTLLTIPNKTLINEILENFTSRIHRRAKYDIGLLYSTSPEALKCVIDAIKAFLDYHPMLNEDGLVRFSKFGSYSLDIEVIYYVTALDYNIFSKTREEVNFEIMKIVREKGCEFAYPSTTIYMAKQAN
jgi:MscS family membrane protein